MHPTHPVNGGRLRVRKDVAWPGRARQRPGMAFFYETPDFYVKANNPPHVSRNDGGHLVIHPKEAVVHRWDFDPRRATALMRLSMLVGEAMLKGMIERGVPVERLNFQDNGNWGIGSDKGPRFHLHLYGRSRKSRNQVHGEALVLPLRNSDYWKSFEAINDGDIQVILAHIRRLEKEDRYLLENWKP